MNSMSSGIPRISNHDQNHNNGHGIVGSIRMDGRLSPRNRLQSSASLSDPFNSTSSSYDEENVALLKSSLHNHKSNSLIPNNHTTTNPSMIALSSSRHDNNPNHDRGITWALYISYLTLMGSKIALPSTLSMLTASSSTSGLSMPKSSTFTTPSQYMAHILSLSTLSLAFGKAITGPLIDIFGGVRSLQVALTILSLMLLNISFTTSFTTFQYSWMTIDFIFASGWAACLNAISHSSSNNNKGVIRGTATTTTEAENQVWTAKIRGLATSARVGNALFFSIFGTLLQYIPTWIVSNKNNNIFIKRWIPNTGQGWRIVYFCSALVQSIPLTLLYVYDGGRTRRENKNNQWTDNSSNNMEDRLPSTSQHQSSSSSTTITRSSHSANSSIRTTNTGMSPLQVLQKELRTLTFWCQLINRSVLILIASFLLFVPSYMTHCFHVSMSSAARVGTVYALGCLLALSPTIHQWIKRSLHSIFPSLHSKASHIVMMNVFLGCLLGSCLVQLLHVSQVITIPVWIGIVTMFVWGFSFAIPFYIPSSVYALARGGTTASATSKFLFDFTHL